jgi:predicted transcriptional regulator
MVNDMTAISLRLPDEIENRLSNEARIEGRPRSEIARAAIVEYLERREKERFMADLVEEARRAYADPEIRREAIEIAEEGTADVFDTVAEDERATGIDPNEKWWR